MKLAIIILGSLLLLTLLLIFALRTKRATDNFYGLTGWHYAHRGLHDTKLGIPENSGLAFRRALDSGYGAELDVHLAKDGSLVVMHDESLKRTAGVDKNVCDCTRQELEALRLEGTRESIPFLEEVLALFEGKAPLVVEIKAYNGNHKELTAAVCRMLEQYPKLQYCIESFDPRVIMWLRRHRPEIIRGQLSCKIANHYEGNTNIVTWLMTNLLFNFLTVPHFVAYCFEERRNFAFRLCKKVWGVQEFSWTIREAREAQAALQEGAAIIFEQFCPEEKETECMIS